MKVNFTRVKRTAGSLAVLALINAYGTGLAFAAEGDAATNAESGKTGPAVDLGTVTVQGRNLLPTYLENIPGGTSIASKEDLEKGSITGIPEALKYQAGVFAPQANGREDGRFSLRGSGLIRGADSWHTGVQFLLDGIPLLSNEGYPFQYADPLFYNYIEVLRGANGFEYGSTVAGGSVNYVPHTGYNSSPFQVRQTSGSWNTSKTQVSSGQVIGDLDYYVSATKYHTDGYRNRSNWDSTRLFTDVGYKITDDLNTRVYFEYGYENFQNASALLLDDALNHPKLNGNLVSPGVYTPLTTNRYDKEYFLIGDKTNYTINDASSVEAGFIYKYFPLLNANASTAANTTQTFYDIHDWTWNINYKRTDKVLGGRENNLKLATIGNYVTDGSGSHIVRTDLPGNPEIGRTNFANSYDLQLIAQDDIEAINNLWVTAGLAATNQSRNINFETPAALKSKSIEQDFFHWLPKLAVRYDFNPKLQVYANYGRTTELSLPHNYPTTGGTPSTYNGINVIGPQTANSFEIGTRGEYGIFRWNLTAYRQYIHDEILNKQTAAATATTPAKFIQQNAVTPTIHQGIEANLDLAVWRADSSAGSWRKGQHGLTLRQALTFNDFYFDGDPVLHNNELPGVPRALYQAGLEYEHPNGFYAGVDTEIASSYEADFANTIHAPDYILWNAKVGYSSPGKGNTWRVFLEGRNLANERYVETITPTQDAAGNYAKANVFTPGVGRSVTIGFEYDY